VRLKVLICGASGFIGKNHAEYYSQKKDYDVYVTQNRRRVNIDNVTVINADLTNKSDVDKAIRGMDVVIQCAATTSGSKDIVERPFVHVTDNVIMNSLILRASYKHGVKKFIFFSCTVMYQTKSQPFIKNPVSEFDFNPSNEIYPAYFGVGWTKVYIEKMCEFYSRLGRTKHYVIRHSNIYGPYDKYDKDRSHLFGATIAKVLDGNTDKIEVWGDGSGARDLLYVDDLVSAVEKIVLIKSSCPYYLLNIGYGKAISIANLVNKIINISKTGKKIIYVEGKSTVNTALSLDCSLAKEILNWEPLTSLDDGIKKTINWYKKHK
jgi:nucleoside-diphosphate-sugar epimerase